LRSTTDPREVLPLYREFQPDLILLDLLMPYLDGYQILELLSSEAAQAAFVPRLVLTADIRPEAKQKALTLGATDFLTKPFDHVELMLRTRNLLHVRLLSLEQEKQNQVLEERVRERTLQLEVSRLELVERLARVAEFRDDETHKHTQRVGRDSAAVAHMLGLPDETVEIIRRVSPLHDIGKIGIPDAILLKPMKLTDAEMEVMRQHTVIGARILEGGQSDLIRMAEELALCHHERWDGSGYPGGRRGVDIPLAARIVSVVDVFDALTHARPYKSAWPAEQAIAEVRRQRSRQFDPDVVDALLLLQECRVLP
jgi:putative two-component system response regulator